MRYDSLFDVKSIYDKSEVSELSDAELKGLVEDFLIDKESEKGKNDEEDY